MLHTSNPHTTPLKSLHLCCRVKTPRSEGIRHIQTQMGTFWILSLRVWMLLKRYTLAWNPQHIVSNRSLAIITLLNAFLIDNRWCHMLIQVYHQRVESGMLSKRWACPHSTCSKECQCKWILDCKKRKMPLCYTSNKSKWSQDLWLVTLMSGKGHAEIYWTNKHHPPHQMLNSIQWVPMTSWTCTED